MTNDTIDEEIEYILEHWQSRYIAKPPVKRQSSNNVSQHLETSTQINIWCKPWDFKPRESNEYYVDINRPVLLTLYADSVANLKYMYNEVERLIYHHNRTPGVNYDRLSISDVIPHWQGTEKMMDITIDCIKNKQTNTDNEQFYFYDQFTNYADSTELGYVWTLTSATLDADSGTGGGPCMKIPIPAGAAVKELYCFNGEVSVQFEIMFDTTTDSKYLKLYVIKNLAGTALMSLGFYNNADGKDGIYWIDQGGTFTQLQNTYATDALYTIKYVYNNDTSTYSVYFEGTAKIEDSSSSPCDVKRIVFDVFQTNYASGNIYIDDVKVWKS